MIELKSGLNLLDVLSFLVPIHVQSLGYKQ